jgi:hypothetical protein
MPPAKQSRAANRARHNPRASRNARQRRGQSLIEFALVALVTYLLLAAIITFGFYFYAAQGSQTTVDFLARELSRSPLPATKVTQFDVFYSDPAAEQSTGEMLTPEEQNSVLQFRRRVYDDHYLVLRQDDVLDAINGGYNQSFVGRLPIVNQQLIPLMISDSIGGVRYFRYPGAVYQREPTIILLDPPPTGYSVRIPIVVGRGELGVETINWVPVVEPVRDGENVDPFPINANSLQQGLVALRINYPVQSGAMSSFRRDPSAPDYPFEPTIGRPNAADDSAVVDNGGQWAPPPSSLVSTDSTTGFGTYAGPYGLGKQAAFGSPQFIGTATGVRPFRRVISAQAIYRREVFE